MSLQKQMEEGSKEKLEKNLHSAEETPSVAFGLPSDFASIKKFWSCETQARVLLIARLGQQADGSSLTSRPSEKYFPACRSI